jgi:hypothetical protein
MAEAIPNVQAVGVGDLSGTISADPPCSEAAKSRLCPTRDFQAEGILSMEVECECEMRHTHL